MKILCETQTVNRIQPNIKTRSIKATLAIGYHPPNREKSELFIIHFTPQNKSGIRYKVKGNLEKVFTKFINDGKATISFKIPEHNILINCNPIQLKCFLQTLKLGLEGKSDMNKLGLSSLATTAVPQKSHPIKSFLITKRGDYPIKGIPKSVETLTITGIKRTSFDLQILSLKNLTTLNLSDNCIKEIPKEFGKLSLKDVNLSKNLLGTTKNMKDWDWMNEHIIQKSLISLNLTENQLSYFPYKLVKFKSLVTLILNENLIKKLPFAIRRLMSLRYLHLSSNRLESLPHSLNLLHLETLDVWANIFLPRPDTDPQIVNKVKGIVPPLWEISARYVVAKRIPYSAASIPSLLVDIISETPLCLCGRLCFTSEIFKRASIITLEHVKQLIFNRQRMIYQDCVVCSEKCASKLRYESVNNNLINHLINFVG